MKIKKAVIPAAGLGIRFLPATKAQPKEMLPIIDKPAIQYIVEEAVRSGIDNILIVTGRNKESIENHFDKSVELEQSLKEKGKWDLLKEIQSINCMSKIHYIRQMEPLGLGHAILCAEEFVGDEPFAVLLGDDIMVSEPPALRQLIDLYENRDLTVVAVQSVPAEDISKYGIISPESNFSRVYQVKDMIEKPSPLEAPSNMAIMGRYILKPSIFSILKTLERGTGNEYQLTDALRKVCRLEGLLGWELSGDRYDIGDKFGYMKAMIEMGLLREEFQPQLMEYLQCLVQKNMAQKQLSCCGSGHLCLPLFAR